MPSNNIVKLIGRRTLVSVRPAVLAALVLISAATSLDGATAQEQRTGDDCGFFCDMGSDFKTFGTSPRTAFILAPGLGLSLWSQSIDDEVITSRINSELYPGTALDGILEPGDIGGGALVQFSLAFTTLAAGELSGNDPVANLGSALVRAQLLNGVVTLAMKHTVRRTRPDGDGKTSFPSGHTSGSFATATILQRQFGWKIGAPAFAFASLVGASRLSENRHHLSDVVFGAAVGLASGFSVRLEESDLPFEVTPDFVAGNMAVRVSIPLGE